MKLILLSFLTLRFSFAQASPAVEELLEANLRPRSHQEEMQVLRTFAADNEAACKTWPPQAFKAQADLADSCQFPRLFKAYESHLNQLKNPQASGLVLPDPLIKGATIPALQSGAWQAVLLAQKEGSESAVKGIVLRIALEKSLRAHAHFIRRQSPELLNSYAALVVPRMIASLSGYSKTLQTLTMINAFECGAEKTLACKEMKSFFRQRRAQVLAGVGSEDFLAGLENLDSENSSRESRKLHQVPALVVLISQMKTELTLKDLMLSLQGKKAHPLYIQLSEAIDHANTDLGGNGDDDFTNMLVATSILSEVYEAQKLKRIAGPQAVPKVSTITTKTAEEMSILKSYVLKVLKANEVVQ